MNFYQSADGGVVMFCSGDLWVLDIYFVSGACIENCANVTFIGGTVTPLVMNFADLWKAGGACAGFSFTAAVKDV